MNTQELINEATSLPTEERTAVIESLLRSLNPPESNIDQQWVSVAQRRLTELQSGNVQPISGEHVFKKIWDRFNR